MEGNRHYIRVDKTGHITSGWSDGLCRDQETAGAVLLREGGGYQFRLLEEGEENPCLEEESGAHLWRWENGQVRAATEQELKAERAEIEAGRLEPGPTLEDRMNDQIETDVDLDYRLSMLELGLV